MLFLLRPGVPPGEDDLARRIEHVNGNVASWRLGWLAWNLAAVALLAFYSVLAARFRDGAPLLCALAVPLAAAGLAADVGAETISMIVLPGAGPESFALAERISLALTGYLGNGLYVVAGVLLTWAGARLLPRALVAFGAVVWALGLGLSASTLGSWEGGQFATTAALMPLFVLWTALVGRWLETAS